MSKYDELDYREDVCYECKGCGDDCSLDEYGELVSNCSDCPYNMENE